MMDASMTGNLMKTKAINEDIQLNHAFMIELGSWKDIPEVEFEVPPHEPSINRYNDYFGRKVERILWSLGDAARALEKGYLMDCGNKDLVITVDGRFRNHGYRTATKSTFQDFLARAYILLTDFAGWNKIEYPHKQKGWSINSTSDAFRMLFMGLSSTAFGCGEGMLFDKTEVVSAITGIHVIANRTDADLEWHTDVHRKFMVFNGVVNHG